MQTTYQTRTLRLSTTRQRLPDAASSWLHTAPWKRLQPRSSSLPGSEQHRRANSRTRPAHLLPRTRLSIVFELSLRVCWPLQDSRLNYIEQHAGRLGLDAGRLEVNCIPPPTFLCTLFTACCMDDCFTAQKCNASYPACIMERRHQGNNVEFRMQTPCIPIDRARASQRPRPAPWARRWTPPAATLMPPRWVGCLRAAGLADHVREHGA